MYSGHERVLRTLRGEPVDRPPVWLMRQAGRYLPEYRALRAANTFLELLRRPDLCTEAALQPLRRYPLDATIVFSDILVIPDALGMGLQFVAGDGPRFERPLRDPDRWAELRWEGLTDRLDYVYAAVADLKANAPEHAVFGFAGAPWTLFCYMVEGSGSSDFASARTALWRTPASSQRVLALLADSVVAHLRAQLAAGADVVQLFDTWGGLLSAADYEEFVVPALRQIRAALPDARIVLFARGGGHLLPVLAGLGFDALSLDATVDLAAARRLLPGVITQGNLDNTRLLGPPEAIIAGVARMRDALAATPHAGHIYNLGHGVLPATPPEAVSLLLRELQQAR